MDRSRWKLLPACPDELLRASSAVGGPLLVQLLYNRGLAGPERQEAFLACDRRLTHDAFLLPDMAQAVSRLRRAILSGERIVVFGDFDADGVTATVLLVEGLSACGARVNPYLPHRVDEGHGLNVAALEEFSRDCVTLVITVDCGVTSVDEVEKARELGIDVIVTDHHTVPPPGASGLPRCIAVVDPKRSDCTYPYPYLAGVGVAYKLLEAVCTAMGRAAHELTSRGLELVALGTIADLSPLTGENRYLVKCGLEMLNSSPRPGTAALLRCSNLEPGRVTAEAVSWALAPRLNAAGRIEHARTSYQLLSTASPDEAQQLAQRLDGINKERQLLAEQCCKQARDQVLSAGADGPILLVADPSFPPGVCGIVAGKLADEFHRPAVVVQVGEESSRGSCRSIPGFDMVSVLDECADLLTQYGGHPAAAGFSLPTREIDQLRRRLSACAAERLVGVDLVREIAIDAEAEPHVVVGEVLPLMGQLGPFGRGNPAPVFLTRNMEVLEARTVGNGGQHLKLKLRKDRVIWPAIAFGQGSRRAETLSGLDVVYTAQVNRWGASETVELDVVDFLPADGTL